MFVWDRSLWPHWTCLMADHRLLCTYTYCISPLHPDVSNAEYVSCLHTDPVSAPHFWLQPRSTIILVCGAISWLSETKRGNTRNTYKSVWLQTIFCSVFRAASLSQQDLQKGQYPYMGLWSFGIVIVVICMSCTTPQGERPFQPALKQHENLECLPLLIWGVATVSLMHKFMSTTEFDRKNATDPSKSIDLHSILIRME